MVISSVDSPLSTCNVAHSRPGCKVSHFDRFCRLRPAPGSWLPKPSTTEFHNGRYRPIRTCSISCIHTGSNTRHRQQKSRRAMFSTSSIVSACSRNRLNSTGARSQDEYWVSVFGTPEAGGTWGWRWEGHHLSLHYTIVDGENHRQHAHPSSWARTPATVPSGPRRAACGR